LPAIILSQALIMSQLLKPPHRTRYSKKAGIIGCGLMLLLMYYLLLGPSNSMFSVYSICQKTEAVQGSKQYLLFCLLPIYFSLMIFGGGALGWLLGRKTHKVLLQRLLQRIKRRR
jgi:hypothetical protein